MIDLASKIQILISILTEDLNKVENYKALQISWSFFISKISDVPPQLLNSNVSEISARAFSYSNIDPSITQALLIQRIWRCWRAFVGEYRKNLLKPYFLNMSSKQSSFTWNWI